MAGKISHQIIKKDNSPDNIFVSFHGRKQTKRPARCIYKQTFNL